MAVPQLPACRWLGAVAALVIAASAPEVATAQFLDNGREISPSLAQPRQAGTAKPPPLFQWEKKDAKSPEFRAWLDNELDWACVLFQRSEDYLAAYERLQDVPADTATPKLVAFRAECLLEKTPPETEKADRLLATSVPPDDSSPYVLYVKSRVAHAQMQPLKAAELLALAVKGGQPFSPWQRERALAVLTTAADRKELVIDRQRLKAGLEDTPPSWLQAALALTREESPKLPVPLLVRLYVAAIKTDFNLDAELLTPEARGEILRLRQGPALLAALLNSHARKLEEQEAHLALGSYLELLRLLAEHREASTLTAEEVRTEFMPRILACAERLTARKNPDRVRAWITAAVADTDSAAWWNLQGFAAYNRAGRETSPERVVRQGRLALEAFDRTIEKGLAADPPDAMLDIYFANRSSVLTLLGMYATDERRAYLTRAVEDAREATRRNPDNDAGWSALGNALELLAWRDLGIGEQDSYAVALQAFQTQIEKGAKGAGGDGLANLGRCFVKRALDAQAGREQLAGGQQTLQQALQRAPGHWDASFWLGRIHLELGDRAAAARAFARAVEHPQHGLYNAVRVGRLLANRPDDCRDILQRVLPDNASAWQSAHAPWLIMRSNWVRRENSGDLEQPQPQSIRDAEAAVRLADHPLARQRALEALAAAQRSAAASRRITAQARQRYRQAAMDTMRQLMRLDPGAPRMWEWGQELAQLLDEDANSESVPGEQQRKMLNEAIRFVDLALAHAPPDQHQELARLRDELIGQGAKADPKRKLAEPK